MSKKVWFAGGKKDTKVKASNPSKMPGCHKKQKRITFHNEGVDRKCDGGSHVANLARYVRDKNIYYHFVYCPDCGHWAQIIPVDAAARSQVGGSVNSKCGNSANRHGKVNIQICFAGYGNKNLPNPKNWKGKSKFKKIAKEWNIKPRAVNFNKVNRSYDQWNNKSIGWFMHGSGPRDDHHDIVGNNLDWKKFKKFVLEIED